MTWTVYEEDCLALMPALGEASVDAVVTDPPYGLEFMGREWDSFRVDDPGTSRWRGDRVGTGGQVSDPGDPTRRGKVAHGGGRPNTYRCRRCGKRDQFRNPHACGEGDWKLEPIDPHAAPPQMLAFGEWSRTWALEALRLLKPGGHLLAFGGSRTYHRLTCALEDAGFEIRDCLMWLHAQGFPKSLDVAKAFDKQNGIWRGRSDPTAIREATPRAMEGRMYEIIPKGDPVTPLAVQWAGWHTALKPGWEPIVLARKPLIGSVADTVRAFGTGALNIDATRLDAAGPSPSVDRRQGPAPRTSGWWPYKVNPALYTAPHPGEEIGRWPANVVLSHAEGCTPEGCVDPCPAGLLDAQAAGQGLDGGASRFFYTAKSDRAEREAGLDSSVHVYQYADAAWVNAGLDRALRAAMGHSPPRGIVASTIRDNAGSAWSMCWCGSLATDPFQPGLTSTIVTVLRSTTASTTWKSSQRQHTNGCMAVACGEMASGGSLARCAVSLSPWAQRTGISAGRDGLSTADADLATSVESWLTSKPEEGGGRRVQIHNLHPT